MRARVPALVRPLAMSFPATLLLIALACASPRAPAAVQPLPGPSPEEITGGGFPPPDAEMPVTPRKVGCRVTMGGDTVGTIFRARDVEIPATVRGVAALEPRPGGDVGRIAFVVDTAGRPDLTTLRVLEPPAPVRPWLIAAVDSLRYQPALFDGCRVRQLVERLVLRTQIQ